MVDCEMWHVIWCLLLGVVGEGFKHGEKEGEGKQEEKKLDEWDDSWWWEMGDDGS